MWCLPAEGTLTGLAGRSALLPTGAVLNTTMLLIKTAINAQPFPGHVHAHRCHVSCPGALGTLQSIRTKKSHQRCQRGRSNPAWLCHAQHSCSLALSPLGKKPSLGPRTVTAKEKDSAYSSEEPAATASSSEKSLHSTLG